MSIPASNLVAALHAPGPAVDRAERLQLYGRLIGDLGDHIITHAPDGARHEGQGEIHFGWILERRAIRDVWMIPRARDRRPDGPSLPVAGSWNGTTIRVYDPRIDAWRIFWIDPATNDLRPQIGRAGAGCRPGGHDGVGLTLQVELHEDQPAVVPSAW